MPVENEPLIEQPTILSVINMVSFLFVKHLSGRQRREAGFHGRVSAVART